MKKRRKKREKLVQVSRLLALLLVIIAFGCSFFRRTDDGDETPARSTIAVPAPGAEIVFEEPYPPEAPQPPAAGYDAGTAGPPRVAVIIDDMGYHPEVGRKLLALDLELTFSFLPYAPHTPELQRQAYELGRDILLHQPLESADPSRDIGPGGLYLATPLEFVAPVVEQNLDRVPFAIGINNHMGSGYTTDAEHMRALLAVVKSRELFFVDSFTTAESVGFLEAADMGIPTARRHVFLDNIHNSGRICHKLEQLVSRALEQGWAIAIGHPNRETLDALTDCRHILVENTRLVGVHELVGPLRKSDVVSPLRQSPGR